MVLKLLKFIDSKFFKKPILKTKTTSKNYKKKFRKIFFKNNIFTGIVFNLEYDPNRNAYIAAIYNLKLNSFFYVIAPKNIKIGDILKSGPEAEKKLGHTMTLGRIPLGYCIYNIALKKAGSAKFSRSAGTYSLIVQKNKHSVKIILSSGKYKNLPLNSFGSIGIVSNELKFLNKIGKAGRSRWLGKKPSVRGVAMNPVDHPHGGGEGKKSGKRKSPWGKPIKSPKQK